MAGPSSDGGDWLGFFWRLGSAAVKKTAADMRREYIAGREGHPAPSPSQQRQAPAPAPRPSGPPWWQILQVPQNASLREAAIAYRELIQKNHPDKVAHLSAAIRQVAEEETRRINAAYETAQRMLGGGGAKR